MTGIEDNDVVTASGIMRTSEADWRDGRYKGLSEARKALTQRAEQGFVSLFEMIRAIKEHGELTEAEKEITEAIEFALGNPPEQSLIGGLLGREPVSFESRLQIGKQLDGKYGVAALNRFFQILRELQSPSYLVQSLMRIKI